MVADLLGGDGRFAGDPDGGGARFLHQLGALPGMAVYLHFPRHAVVCAIAGVLLRHVQPGNRAWYGLPQRLLPQRAQLHHFGADAEHLRLYHRDFRRGYSRGTAR
ncbi:hypothetical protein D3C72_1971220 [compost metagenome]